MNKHLNIINALIFQIIWWGILLLKSHGEELWLVIIAVMGIAAQLLVLKAYPIKRLAVWLILALFGFAIDLGIAQTPIFQLLDTGAPIWLFLIWVLFVSTLNHSLSYFKGRYILSSIGGAIFGPICYLAAGKWGVLTYTTDTYYILLHGLIWALIFNLFLYLTHLGEKKCVH